MEHLLRVPEEQLARARVEQQLGRWLLQSISQYVQRTMVRVNNREDNWGVNNSKEPDYRGRIGD
jgi:hypothetical protein